MEPQSAAMVDNKEKVLPSEKAAPASPSSGAASTPRRALRGRGASRTKAEVSAPRDTNGAASAASTPGRVLRDRSTRALPAWRQSEMKADDDDDDGGGGGHDAASTRRRKPAYPRRRRNAAAPSSTDWAGEAADGSGPAADCDGDKEPANSRAPRSRRSQALGRPRPPRGSPRPVCKSEPDAELAYVETEKIAGRKAVASGKKEEERPGEHALPAKAEEAQEQECPSLGTDQPDQNYRPQQQSGEDEISSDEDVPFRDDLNDQSYDPKAERDPHKPRRKPPSRQKEKKEKVPQKEKELDIKLEGGDSKEVKLENEFGEVTEPPRKRGRRRKDDKSPRLPKRRKKPPVQYVRCEIEGCGTVLAHPRYLQHHIKYQHLLKKKYVCPHPSCGRLFRLQKQLLRHAKHHTDQRDYICEFCARAFKSSHNLAVHRMIHTGEKPLQCEICGFTCRQKASLNWHMKKHDADATYQFSCGICGKKFEKKDSVVAHKAKSHPEVLIAEALAANAGALITTPGALLEASSSGPTTVAADQSQQQDAQVGQVAPLVVVGQDTHTLHTMQVPVTLALPTSDDEGAHSEHQPPPPPPTHTLQLPLQFVSATPAVSQGPIHQLTLQSSTAMVTQPQQLALQAYSPQMQTQILHMTFQPVTHNIPQQPQAHVQQFPLLTAAQQQLSIQQAAQTQQALQRLTQHGLPSNPALVTQATHEETSDGRGNLGFNPDAAPPANSTPATIQEPGEEGVVWEGGRNGEAGSMAAVWERAGEDEGILAEASNGQVQHGLM
ncbi:E3 ubiquitin-protein ligase ZFP91 [Denticeps clupeoides]|uniref:E3 ubiquitin-protein ligase ZFP91 n=1 Tax=Denticeps clupeoides TaxID=299321 RepID=A0AAY4A9Y8_9TELE|nr:E3 ubiquitin-protein ligase ZFP91 [Denticeps clupeoides]